MQRHFVSYPKSGRSWVRYMLAQLGVDADIVFQHDRFEFNNGARPPHDFSLERRLAQYANIDRVVYLERDPRDVMVSLYHQVTGRFQDFFGYTGTLSQFVRDDYFGAENLRRFRALWAELVAQRGFLKITYEDCHADAALTLRRVVDYYGFDLAEDRIVAAVASAAFDKMREVEQSEAFPQPWLRPRNGALKVRRGKVGGFRDSLSTADIAYLDAVFGLRATSAAQTG